MKLSALLFSSTHSGGEGLRMYRTRAAGTCMNARVGGEGPDVVCVHGLGGLMAATLGRDEHGAVIRKAGVMGVVRVGGDVRPGDRIRAELPARPHRPLQRV